jgi:protein-disulfide isomerase
MQGQTKAPITLVQYGDYECPSCGRAAPIVKALQKRLGTKMRFVFRNFPLSQHPHAMHAAEIAEAASVHNKFWDMHDMLYRHQDALDDQSLLGYAIEVGLDPDAVGKEASSDKVITRLKADMKSGTDSGIQGTPAFFINGQSHDEPWDEETLFAAMERVLEDQ